MTKSEGAGLWAYLKKAFFFRWNLLFGAAGVAAAALSPMPEVLLPLVGAAELLYLMGITSIPRFRAAVDAEQHKAQRERAPERGEKATPQQAIDSLITGLRPEARRRFEQLRKRCLEMRAIAKGVGGRTSGRGKADEVSNPGLDRLLWVFLRMLYSQNSLRRFLEATDEDVIQRKIEEVRGQLESAETDGDDRLVRSLRDSLATRELQMDNYSKAQKNAEFVTIELDRLEAKIQTLSEMAVNRQDPDFITREVDSVAASIQSTEEAMEELHLVDGLLDGLSEPPPILEADLRGVLENEA